VLDHRPDEEQLAGLNVRADANRELRVTLEPVV
jgi:hypothetical protein